MPEEEKVKPSEKLVDIDTSGPEKDVAVEEVKEEAVVETKEQEIKNLKKHLNQPKVKLQVEELVLNMVHQHNHIIFNMDMDQQKLDLEQVNLR